MQDKPYIAAEDSAAELTVRSVFLAILLTLLLAMSNSYLALKLGILTSASIPAAIISMGILRLFKNPSILENNAVQTAASAGEAVAGGIVYTIPALIIIGYWHDFDYLTNFLIAAFGGVLGVFFSIPLRRILVNDPSLKFPEGRAIAEVLKSSAEKNGLKDIVMGGMVGGLIELFQIGFKIIANSWSYWFVAKRTLFGFGAGFSATMIGAGYLIGHELAISIFSGAIFSWLIALPLASHVHPAYLAESSAEKAGILLWNNELRYLGIGAMLFAGIWTFCKLIKPLVNSIKLSFKVFEGKSKSSKFQRTDKDIPMPFIFIGVILTAALLFLFFQFTFPITDAGIDENFQPMLVFSAVIYVLIIGFLFSVITAYFSGMVGVTASPGSSVVIAGMLFAAWLLLSFINYLAPLPLSHDQIKAAEAITIVIGSVVTGIAAIANDNTQDLKVGQLVGATPWKQQVMLLLGVIVSAMVIPPVMQLLFDVYGIAGVMPHEGMDPAQALPAPTAALMAAITEAVFRNTLPWDMMFVGAGVILLIICLDWLLGVKRYIKISILGVAIGMYLPLASSFPLFLGGMIALFVDWRMKKSGDIDYQEQNERKQRGTMIACGLVAGSALIDVILAIPFSIFHSPDALSVVYPGWHNYGLMLAVLTTLVLALWITRRVCEK